MEAKQRRRCARGASSFSDDEIGWLENVIAGLLSTDRAKLDAAARSVCIGSMARKCRMMRRQVKAIRERQAQRAAEIAADLAARKDARLKRRAEIEANPSPMLASFMRAEACRREYIALVDGGMPTWKARNQLITRHGVQGRKLLYILRDRLVEKTRASMAEAAE